MSMINKIIERYQGGNEYLSDEDDDYLYKNNLHDELANWIVYCFACGWWCDSSEMNEGTGDGDICDDCKREQEE